MTSYTRVLAATGLSLALSCAGSETGSAGNGGAATGTDPAPSTTTGGPMTMTPLPTATGLLPGPGPDGNGGGGGAPSPVSTAPAMGGGGAEGVSSVGGAAGGGAGAPPVVIGPLSHEGPLFGGLTEAQRRSMYYFQESAGQVVIEAENFVTQLYGNDVYKGKRWWMVQKDALDVKTLPEFAERCALAKQELADMDTVPPGATQTIRAMITNHKDMLNGDWESVITMFGCDPDPIRPGSSGGSYLELLPDNLFNNNNQIPHAGANWYSPEQSPRVYYRVNFSSAGSYTFYWRGVNSDTDSGNHHLGVASTPGTGETYQAAAPQVARDGQWHWGTGQAFMVQAGEYYLLMGGREDGYEVDKIVFSKGACSGCDGMGPPESATRAD